MSNQGVQTRGKAKFGSVSAAAVIDAVVTNSLKSAVEGTIRESVATKAAVKKEKVTAGKKKQAKVSNVAGLPTSSSTKVFDFIDDAIDTTHQLSSNTNIDIAGQKKKAKVGRQKRQATVVADLPSIDVTPSKVNIDSALSSTTRNVINFVNQPIDTVLLCRKLCVCALKTKSVPQYLILQ
jgi:hypothetical protein